MYLNVNIMDNDWILIFGDALASCLSCLQYQYMERGSSAVECRTRNQVSPGSNPPLVPFRRLGIFVLSINAPVDSAVGPMNEYLAIESGGHVSDLIFARNCSIARMLPGEAELVSE